MNPRKEIREAAHALIYEGVNGQRPTTAGRNVYATRMAPIWPEHTPAVAVYTRAEEIAQFRDWQLPVKRTLTLAFEVYAAGEDADDQIDAITHEIEERITTDDTLGQRVESVAPASLETGIANDAGSRSEEPIIIAVQTMQVAYWTKPQEADTGVIPKHILINACGPFGIEEEYEEGHPAYVLAPGQGFDPTDPVGRLTQEG